MKSCFLADRTATQYDRLVCGIILSSVRLSGAQGRCSELKVVPLYF